MEKSVCVVSGKSKLVTGVRSQEEEWSCGAEKAMVKISQRNGVTMKQWEEGESGSVSP
jgi:hypothetical protein